MLFPSKCLMLADISHPFTIKGKKQRKKKVQPALFPVTYRKQKNVRSNRNENQKTTVYLQAGVLLYYLTEKM